MIKLKKTFFNRALSLGFAFLLSASMSCQAFAFDIGLGVGAIDSGDNRLVRSAALTAGGPQYSVGVDYYGTQNAVFTVQDIAISGLRRWNTGFGALDFVAGLAVFTEVISYFPDSDPAKGVDKSPYLSANGPKAPDTRQRRTYYNGAGVLGLRYRQALFAGLWTELSWTSQIFPAGTQTLLLTTDMHDVWAISFGVSI